MEPTTGPHPPSHPSYPSGRSPRRHPRSQRGAWTIAAIFAVGGLVYAGLWLAPRARPPAAPVGVPFGVPEARLCFVTCDLRGRPHTVESVVTAVRAVSPLGPRAEFGRADYVLFVGVEADEITDLAAGLGMQASYHPQLFQRAGKPRGGKLVGVCLLSRYPLYEGARIGAGNDATAGVAAATVVAGRKFLVACVDLETDAGEDATASLLRWVKEAGAEPLLVGGVLGAAAERVGKAGGLADVAGEAHSSDGASTRPAPARPLLAPPQWAGTGAGAADADGAGSLSWVVVEPAAAHDAATPGR